MKDTCSVEAFSRIHAEPVQVEHAKLKRFDPEGSPFKSECPVCTVGILLVTRHPHTFALLRRDRCVHCGQVVIYTDASIGPAKFSDSV